MRFTTILPMLLAAGVVQAQAGGQNKNGQNNAQQNKGQNNNNNNNQNNGGNANVLALNPANVQKNSNSDGLANAEAGQAASAK
jgi:transcription initiation factor TFIID subunit 15